MNGWIITLGLVAGNFIYQMVVASPNWMTAFERSLFQVTAIGLYVLLSDKS